ncbi:MULTISPECIES: hypothetical protein [unclassified Methylobacterium]|uniref:hypothetical protein n=1 Tax=unclassified Methylobacterium TaxID=2615210 RepID=UPI001FBBC0B2|nr:MULTISPECIES: hypothetical protein [unclassified Methylobacterium]MCJ2022443.1 hypothetical protein [Methylobacterium sp. E-065]
MRSVLALMLATFAPAAVQAACVPVPMPETSTELRSSFGTRMQQLGAGDWSFAIETPRGTMYHSRSTLVRFFTKEAGDRIEEAGLLLPPEGTTADAARMEAAATFLGAHISGSSESNLQSRVIRAIAVTRRDGTGQAVREDDTVLMFSSPEPGAVALVAGRMRCR